MQNRIFTFVEHDWKPPAGNLVVRIPGGIQNADLLLSTLAKELRFPGDFGDNWNALSDFLTDFHWLTEEIIWIVHSDIPPLSANDLENCLSVLSDAVASWHPGDAHQLVVAFPTDCRTALERQS